MFSWIALGLAAVSAGSLAFLFVAIWATVRHVRREGRAAPGDPLPPVSLLKPIKGLEESLEPNLRSFFEQDYPAPMEVVFASTGERDPGIALARRVAADYPHVPARFVRSDPAFGLNPKVANLAGAMAAARHDLVLQSDANVRARPDYLRRVVGQLLDADGSLLTSLVVGSGERSAGAAMENLQLSAFIAPAMCTALHLAGIHCVVGKSMLLRKSELEACGGLAQVRDILAEDFVLGRRYQELGKRIVLSPTTVENVNERIGVGPFLGRHSRWLKMRAVIHLGGFFGDLGANPVALLGWAFVLSGFDAAFGVALLATAAAKATSDAILVRIVRGRWMRPWHALLSPVKDTLMGLVWVYAAFSRSVEWRGVRLRIGKESRLRPDDGALPLRVLRRVFAR